MKIDWERVDMASTGLKVADKAGIRLMIKEYHRQVENHIHLVGREGHYTSAPTHALHPEPETCPECGKEYGNSGESVRHDAD